MPSEPMPSSRLAAGVTDLRRSGANLLAGAALLASVVTSVVAIIQTGLLKEQLAYQRQQTNSAVWPLVRPTWTDACAHVDDVLPSEPPCFGIGLENFGTGPALVQLVEVRLRDKPVGSWEEVVQALTGRTLPELQAPGLADPERGVWRGSSRSIVIPAGRRTVLFASNIETIVGDPRAGDAAGLARRSAWHNELSLRVCYCSLLDECWEAGGRSPWPERVDGCNPDEPGRFRDTRPEDWKAFLGTGASTAKP